MWEDMSTEELRREQREVYDDIEAKKLEAKAINRELERREFEVEAERYVESAPEHLRPHIKNVTISAPVAVAGVKASQPEAKRRWFGR